LKGSAIFRLLAIVGLATAVALAQNPTQRAQEFFARGVERQRKGDLAGARQAYEEAHRLAPRRVDVLSNLGLVFSQMREQDRAIQCFDDALKIDPNQPIVRFNLGLAYMQAGRFEPAQVEFNRVLKAQPTNLGAHRLRGLCLLKLGRLEDGIEELETVRHAKPEDLDLACTVASVYIKLKQLDKAEPIVHDLEKLNSAEAHFIVGSYYLEKLDHRRAVKELTQTLEQNPRFPDAHAQLAYAYFFEFKWDLSVKMCEEELAIDPDDDNAVKLLGSLYRQRGRLEEAEALLDKAARQNPNDYEILYQIGLLDVAKDDYARAVDVLEKVTQLNPDFPPAHITLVRTYGKLKRSADAQREQVIVNRLNAERKNQPTVRDKALYDAFKVPEESR
jgi:protein O-GlcNAc transferase